MAQILITSKDSTETLGSLISHNKWDRILLVTGKRSYEISGSKDYIEKECSNIDIQLSRFSDFQNNPNIDDLRKGIVFAEKFVPDAIIAIGGGSVMDMGKLIRFFYTHDGEILSGSYNTNSNKVPLIAVPTTAGTGSEATHFAVLYDEEKEKHSISSPEILPEYVILRPELTYNQSSYLTACAGFDALAQSIEAYWNKNATVESDAYAERAMKLLYDTLPKVVKKPTPELREKMSEGAYWAGRAINITKTTAPHAFSYPFTSHYRIPHGHAVALTFPYIADFNFSRGYIPEQRKTALCTLLETSCNIYTTLKNYILAIGLVMPVNKYDPNLILRGISLERLANNPANINSDDALAIINKVIGRI